MGEILAGSALLLLRFGLAMYVIGLNRAKNAGGAALRAIADTCTAVLAFWLIGAAILAQRHHPFASLSFDFFFAPSGYSANGLFVMSALMAVAAGIPGGALAERAKFGVGIALAVLLAGFVIPIATVWTRPGQGWLGRWGYIDPTGGSWVHIVCGVCALLAARAVGPRLNKYNRDGSASVIPGHSVPLAGMGVLVMAATWAPYVYVLAAYRSTWGGPPALNVLLAGSAGGMASLILGQVRYGKPDILLTLIGLLGGLVSITAGAASVATPWAVLIGAIGGLLVPMAALKLDLNYHIDDPAGAAAVHLVGGAWGTLAAGLFATPPSWGALPKQVGVQCLGVVAITLFAAVCSWAVLMVLSRTIGLRAKEADELDGLDLAEHDIGAYPDFQQNTIRSFHLREQ